LKDFLNTPMGSRFPGLLLHAHIVDQLLRKAIHPIHGTMKFKEIVLRARMPHGVCASDHDGQQGQAVVRD